MLLFNVMLTSLPVISLGVLEQDVSSDVCLQVNRQHTVAGSIFWLRRSSTQALLNFFSALAQFPALYQQGQRNIHFSWVRIIGWIVNGVLASVVILTMNIGLLSSAAFREEGDVADVAHLGAITFTCVIWTVNCQIALIINHFTWIQHLFIWGSILSWYIFLLIYGALPPKYSNGAFQLLVEAIGPAPMYWMVTLLVAVVSLLPYVIYLVIQRTFYPMDDHVIQEMRHFRRDIMDHAMWVREQNNSKTSTHVGFSARVEAKISSLKKQSHTKRSHQYINK